MISLVEIADRMRNGPKMGTHDWDMQLFRHMSELVKKFEIKCPTEPFDWINTDNSLADAAWQAAVEFVIEIGCFCISRERIVKFSEEEVKEAIRSMQKEVTMGEGKDVRTWKQHKIEGNELLNIAPGHHAPFTEDLANTVVHNFAMIPRLDLRARNRNRPNSVLPSFKLIHDVTLLVITLFLPIPYGLRAMPASYVIEERSRPPAP